MLVGIVAPPAVGQEVKFGGQVRPRFEFREPVGTEADAFTSMRVRAHATATLERSVLVFIQVQDVRLWGEETSTLGDFRADNFDLHQGYVELRSSSEGPFRARFGRQVVSFGGERLLGAVEWTQQGRAFDGILLGTGGDFGTVDLFGFKLAEATDPDIPNDAELAGAYARLHRVAGGTLDLYGIYDRVAGASGTSRATLGARLAGEQPPITYRVEGSYQFGDAADLNVAAFMLGARVGASLAGGAAQVTLWYDYLSGDDDPSDNDVGVFNTLFATNHKFYGFADLFLNIAAHTNGLGLQDLALKGSVAPRADLRLNVDVHTFHVARRGTLVSRHLGEEMDFTVNYRYSPNLRMIGGFSYVFAGSALAAIGRLTQNMTFGYLMLNATL